LNEQPSVHENLSRISLPANSQGQKNNLNLSGSFENVPFRHTLSSLLSDNKSPGNSFERPGPPIKATSKEANK
jgi:hypothetical protein